MGNCFFNKYKIFFVWKIGYFWATIRNFFFGGNQFYHAVVRTFFVWKIVFLGKHIFGWKIVFFRLVWKICFVWKVECFWMISMRNFFFGWRNVLCRNFFVSVTQVTVYLLIFSFNSISYDRIARAYDRSGATWTVVFNISKVFKKISTRQEFFKVSLKT